MIFNVPSANAIPAFAREYATSCTTCHVGFPKLNPFGEAFRLNGYRLPKETEDQIKIKPVSPGAEAYKKMWPKAIYPSDLPGQVPLALNVKMASVEQSNFHDVRVLRMNETPKIEVHLVRNGEAPGGIGEPGTAAPAPALANAIFAATGKRIRKLPLENQLRPARGETDA